MEISTTVLVCPRNDEESLQILRLAEAHGVSVLVSTQPHGARLEKEPNLLPRILEENPNVSQVVVVEIPGPRVEEELQGEGLTVTIIDHHRYDDLDRMQEKSSLEQFCELFELTDEKLEALGFDPVMIASVAAIDRGFLWELDRLNLTQEERAAGIAYYKSLSHELNADRYEREEAAAREVWEGRRMEQGILILESHDDSLSIRNALSFLVAEAYPKHPPETIVVQGTRRVYVQESSKAKALFDQFGGFTFGRDQCWGKLSDTGDLPSVAELLAVLLPSPLTTNF